MQLRRPISPVYATPPEAIAYLASACDGAIRRDGQGFSTELVRLGHNLAKRRRWGRRHRRNALNLIRYYRHQLSRADFDVDAVPENRRPRALLATRLSTRCPGG